MGAASSWRLTQRLELRQGQSLVMTPQLQQAIKLLQMSNLELQAFVEGELERNPLLERDERGEPTRRDPKRASSMRTTRLGAECQRRRKTSCARSIRTWKMSTPMRPAPMRAAVTARRQPIPAGRSLAPTGRRFARRRRVSISSASLTKTQTLAEHLTEQLNLAIADPADRLIGQHLIGMVNEAGYLTGDLPTSPNMLGTDAAIMSSACSQSLQGFDPAGVFARDLQECLALQLQGARPLRSGDGDLIDNLDLVAKRDFAALQDALQGRSR